MSNMELFCYWVIVNHASSLRHCEEFGMAGSSDAVELVLEDDAKQAVVEIATLLLVRVVENEGRMSAASRSARVR